MASTEEAPARGAPIPPRGIFDFENYGQDDSCMNACRPVSKPGSDPVRPNPYFKDLDRLGLGPVA